MKKFERLIVYPLLIVALFYSLPGEQVSTATENVIDRLVVREISVVNDEGKEIVNIGNSPIGGEILIDNILSEEAHNVLDGGGLRLIGESRNLNLTTGSLSLRSEDYITSIFSHRISIRENTAWNEPYDEYLYLGISEAGSGMTRLNNSKGDNLIYLGESVGGHGLLNVFDKYGEDWRSYRHR